MSANPAISVIIPAYNAAPYISRAIHSVLRQTYSNFEVIVIDDGSIDETKNIVNNMAHSDIRIRYYYQANSGVSSARNAGVLRSRGQYIAFLDSDDEWEQNKLQIQFEFIEGNPQYSLVGCGFRWLDKNGGLLAEQYGECPPSISKLQKILKIRSFNFGGSSGILMCRRVFDTVGLFDTSLEGSEDRDMWLRVVKNYKVTNVSEILITIHLHDNNAHLNVNNMLMSRLRFIHKNIRACEILLLCQALSFAFLDASHESIVNKKKKYAFIYAFLAIVVYPWLIDSRDDKYQILVKSCIGGILKKSE